MQIERTDTVHVVFLINELRLTDRAFSPRLLHFEPQLAGQRWDFTSEFRQIQPKRLQSESFPASRGTTAALSVSEDRKGAELQSGLYRKLLLA